MNDFKNKFYMDFFILALIIFISVLMLDEGSIFESFSFLLILVLCCTFVFIGLNLFKIITKQKEFISRKKQKVYTVLTILIIIGVFVFDYKHILTILSFPLLILVFTLVISLTNLYIERNGK